MPHSGRTAFADAERGAGARDIVLMAGGTDRPWAHPLSRAGYVLQVQSPGWARARRVDAQGRGPPRERRGRNSAIGAADDSFMDGAPVGPGQVSSGVPSMGSGPD